MTKEPKLATEKQPRGGNVDLVYSTLRDDILELRRAPGEVLDEAEIAATFGLSRSPVREAIVRLTAEGLAEALKNRGAVVSRLDIETLPAYFDAQTLLFRLTSRLAAQRGGPLAAARLQRIQDRHETIVAARDANGVILSNRQFHLEIAAIGGNRYYQDWLGGILDQGQRIMRLYVRLHDEAVPTDQLSFHHALIDAIARKDVDAADRAAAADAQIVRDEISRQISAGAALTVPL
ncbi:GntR family transcriptional regulator [Tabrizicola sp. TH137]|uniref:GntR family transcriptional regulator n=1 Tax=Tabrizicola sp. TH137 TaxID=2067452 RepID=UPI0013042494|nr:GntR family transcriptional regulator [Tabrizicola sp. TH137]